jgi:hypothetical protein
MFAMVHEHFVKYRQIFAMNEINAQYLLETKYKHIFTAAHLNTAPLMHDFYHYQNENAWL